VAQPLARHDQSTGLFVSGLGPPRRSPAASERPRAGRRSGAA